MPERLKANLMVLCGAAIWGSGFPATEGLLETWGPVPLVPARLVTGGLVLTLVLLVTGRGRALLSLPWRRAAFVGFCGVGCSTIFLIVGQAYSDPVTVSIIATSLPLMAAIMATVTGDEVVSPRILCGVLLAIAGGVGASLAAATAGPGFRGGEIFVLCAVVLFTWYSRSLVRRLPELGDIAAAASTLALGGLLLIPFVAAAGAFDLIDMRMDFRPRALGLLFWMGGVAVACSLVLWRAGIRTLGVTVAGIHQNAVPFWVMIFVLLTGGDVYLGQAGGAVFVIAGVLLAQLPFGRWWAEARARQSAGR